MPVSVLRQDPYLLEWGDSVVAKVIATNARGDSAESLEGNGATLMTNPDTPINFAEDMSLRTASTIGL